MDAYELARHRAGHIALRLVKQWGEMIGEQMIAGAFVGFCLALVAVSNQRRAIELFNEVIGALPKPSDSRLRLVVDNGRESA